MSRDAYLVLSAVCLGSWMVLNLTGSMPSQPVGLLLALVGAWAAWMA